MKYIIIALTGILLLFNNEIYSQDESFQLRTQNFKPYYPAFTGNGHYSVSTSVTGTLPAESYMIKVYEQAENDIPRIACLPEWNEINFYNGSKWLNDSYTDTTKFSGYQQQLNMYEGTVQTVYTWNDNGKTTLVNTVSFVSRSAPGIAVIRFEVVTNYSGPVKISFPFKERKKPERMELARLEKVAPNPPGKWPAEWYPGFTEVTSIKTGKNKIGGRINALSQTEGRHTKVAFAIDALYTDEIKDAKLETTGEAKSADITITFVPEKRKKYVFYKFISAASGSGEAEAEKNLEAAVKKGYEELFSEHSKEWSRLWETDIKIKGDDELQKIIHSDIFYLLCSIDANTQFNIAPMGLATSGYYGHIFWDADTYMLPPLLLMHPEIARSMIDFRYNNLESAKKNAVKNNYKGAMYPWESDERGEETTPYFAYQNAIKENHIVGDVALGQWQYFLATRDTAWLKDRGIKVINETADFWVSRVHYNKERDKYEIGKVVSVSEGLTDVSNETYTNAIAKINLEIAAEANRITGGEIKKEWKEISTKLVIPFDENNKYHPIHEGANVNAGANEDFWKSVAPLLRFPLQMEMSDTVKRNDLEHAVGSLLNEGSGANMGINFLTIIAAELGDDSLFNLTIKETVRGFLRPPFNVLAETHTNNSINFTTGAGAFLQQVIFGYTGLRLTEEGLTPKYQPMLPKNIKSLELKNFWVGKKKYNIVVEGDKLQMSAVE
jgi:trehalose/maltose hydrolase-like predicted phosphorylase